MPDLDRDGISDNVESAIALESGNINPSNKFDLYKGAARPTLKFVAIASFAYFSVADVPEWKWNSLLVFLGSLFVVRGCEKAWDMHTARKIT